MSTLRIETANSVWFFDEERAHFRRVPRGAEEVFANEDWEPYYGLEIDVDTGAFTVLLDPDGARRYRSWTVDTDLTAPDRSPAPAPGSDADATAEISLLRAPE
jgi:hypothetical protein